MSSMLVKKDWATAQRSALSATAIITKLAEHPGWTLDGDGANVAIQKTFTFADYLQTMSFVNAVAFIAERYEEGLAYARRTIQCTPAFIGGHRGMAALLSQLGRMQEARQAVSEVLRIQPQCTVTTTRRLPFRNPEALERYCVALARAGLPD